MSQSKHKASQMQIYKKQKNVQRFAQSNTPYAIMLTMKLEKYIETGVHSFNVHVEPFENICGNQYFFLFPKYILSRQRHSENLNDIWSSSNAFSLISSKFYCLERINVPIEDLYYQFHWFW